LTLDVDIRLEPLLKYIENIFSEMENQ
jgi:hypothetical protein